ncbi:MAG: hypothetical protein APU95_06010 [Hadesarchaea archaeon YNP_N21]|jgi:predicted nuclease with RNAse H fold|nr:MAG: hypothetical protein APU95_06010 [Hadesarchaea archaeon YNP_N21]
MKIMGIDLAGNEDNPTGLAWIRVRNLTSEIKYSDREIIRRCLEIKPKAVAIDAPLSLPKMGALRKADRYLISSGFRVFPPTFAGMKKLTLRGIRISSKLRMLGFKVIEVHPRTSGKIIFGTPERKVWVSGLKMRGMRLRGLSSVHEIDAALAALTALFWLRGKFEKIGEAEEGVIVIPKRHL